MGTVERICSKGLSRMHHGYIYNGEELVRCRVLLTHVERYSEMGNSRTFWVLKFLRDTYRKLHCWHLAACDVVITQNRIPCNYYAFVLFLRYD